MHPRDGESWRLTKLGGRGALPAALIIATLGIGILLGTLVSRDVGAADAQAAAPDATPLVIPDPVEVENQFTEIARRVTPSVVNIRVESFGESLPAPAGGDEGEGESEDDEEEEPSSGEDQRMEDFFRRFFGMPEGGGGSPDPRRRRGSPGEGSGVVVDSKGYIITNRHVVRDADRIRVRFPDDDEMLDAVLIGSDEETDLAVIKVNPSAALEAAQIGNSDAVNVGDWALAIGSPFGFRETVTVGIISAKSREVQSAGRRNSRPFQKFFQTDAAINPGNSGGPLVNIRGEVIGINTAIVSRTGGYEGLGFALPSNDAVGVYNQIIQYGRVSRGSIGIRFDGDQNPALLREYGAKDGGVFVLEVTEDWPAQKAGMKAEDIIVAVDGKNVEDGDHLIEIVASKPVGSNVAIDVIRSGRRVSLDVEIADREELLRSQNQLLSLDRPRPGETPGGDGVDFGVTVQNLTESMRNEMDYDGEQGVVVTAIEAGSFADDIGLIERDVIVSINRTPVESLEDLREIRDGLKGGDDVAVKVMRRGRGGFTPIYLAGVLAE